VPLGDAIGTEIDAEERRAYSLFPDLREFHSGRVLTDGEGRYRLEYREREDAAPKSRSISPEAFELTRSHVGFVERHLAPDPAASDEVEALVLWRMALRYSAERRYDVVTSLLGELRSKYPALSETLDAAAFEAEADRLAGSRDVLYLPGSLVDRSGRADILIFAGYYGLWLGIATPLALGADSAQEFALGPLLLPTTSILLAHALTKYRGISEAEARFVAVGGHFGIWQGLGWAVFADAEGQAVAASGVLAGLAGVLTAAVAIGEVRTTEGHSALTNAGMYWGAWFGLLAGIQRDAPGEEVLRDALIGSGGLTLAAAIGAAGSTVPRKRVWLTNAGGVVGAVTGLGVILLAEVSSERAASAILLTGSVVGGALAWARAGPGRAEARTGSSAPGGGRSLAPVLAAVPRGNTLTLRVGLRVGESTGR